MSFYFALFRLKMGENALKNAVFWHLQRKRKE
jgi:hypothetical protein